MEDDGGIQFYQQYQQNEQLSNELRSNEHEYFDNDSRRKRNRQINQPAQSRPTAHATDSDGFKASTVPF